nr:MAG TPA: hypothetical protein [Caudoviricetes sp.]
MRSKTGLHGAKRLKGSSSEREIPRNSPSSRRSWPRRPFQPPARTFGELSVDCEAAKAQTGSQ